MLQIAQTSSMLRTTLYPGDSYPSCSSNRRFSQLSTIDSSAAQSQSGRIVEDTARIYSARSGSSTPVHQSQEREGLRTPPPEPVNMNGEEYSSAIVPFANYHSSSSRGHIRQFEPTTQSSLVPNMLDCFRTQQPDVKRKRVSPPSRRVSFAQQQQQMKEESRSRRSSTSLSTPLTIPASINSSNGSLAEFAAQITCFFWFESSGILHKVSESAQTPIPAAPLIPDAIPGIGFRKWVTTILSTTQVSQNAINVSRLGLQSRSQANADFLYTVLDDNTYTNKTWAEVSGITVGEIHVMEVEFLSNMRYSLFTSEAEWLDWHIKLGKFGEFWDRAQRTPSEPTPRAPVNMPSFSNMGQPPLSLPSPPTSNSASPPFPSAHSPGSVLPPPLALATYQTPASISPKSMVITPVTEVSTPSRKRHYDDSAMQPPSKRLSRSGPSMMGPQFSLPLNINTPAPNPYSSRMPISGTSSQSTTPTSVQPQQPFFSNTKAMSTVYPPPPSTTWYPSHTLAAPIIPPPVISHNMNVSPFSQSRHSSPFLHHSNTSSPTGGFSTNSPSLFLSQRDSPYRPVRHVNTLLAPPHGSGEPQQLEYNQMQYQPLAKSRADPRTGLVPYNQPDLWFSNNWSMST